VRQWQDQPQVYICTINGLYFNCGIFLGNYMDIACATALKIQYFSPIEQLAQSLKRLESLSRPLASTYQCLSPAWRQAYFLLPGDFAAATP
jgi:hypothetical protein